jgi:hypothetical protein
LSTYAAHGPERQRRKEHAWISPLILAIPEFRAAEITLASPRGGITNPSHSLTAA